jgi:hypothetical protein
MSNAVDNSPNGTAECFACINSDPWSQNGIVLSASQQYKSDAVTALYFESSDLW